jgi:transposase
MTDAAAEIEALRAALAEAEARADAESRADEAAQAKAAAAHAQALVSGGEALIAHLKLEIEKLRRELYGQRSERKQRLLDQLELQLEEMEATASEDEALAAAAAEKAKTTVGPFQRRKPVRKPFPEHLPRERVVLPAPCDCAACGSSRLVKMGEDVTETLEVIPRQWKVIQTVREKFTCRDCERISQPPAPFHPTPRGWAGPSLLAMIVFEKYGQHQPLNRQAERYAREGVELSLSTLADQVGAVAAALAPLHALIEAHVMAAERLHGDDTTVPLLAKGKTETARLWTYVRDDRPFGGPAPPAALFRFSRDRRGEHPDNISPAGAASSRPTPMPASTPSSPRRASRGRSCPLLLGACSAEVLRAGRHRRQRAAREEGDADLAARPRGGEAHRRHLRSRARHQRPARRAAAGDPKGRDRAARRRPPRLDDRRARPALGTPPSPRRWTTC